ncbi:MAG: transcription termination/antitermination protein NusA [Candidatus Magasanikbacteria bacterium]|nr:transcription termination/antitermination protein NusA [Candidatus Magasanikbacteria bacterium]NCS71934.1 transcription termination/antitermination protein NusA [Candidatus Magasanikbacteria bacterium]
MSEIAKAIQHICDEKELEYDVVIEAIESALAAAYRKDFGNKQQNIKIEFDPMTSDIQAWDVKEVVEDIDDEALESAQEQLAELREHAREQGREITEEETDDIVRFNPKTEIMLKEAKEIKKTAKIGDILEIVLDIPGDFGRMAAQTAKQVVIQKLREAERVGVFDDFKSQEGKTVQGVVQRRDRSGVVIIDLGKITGILPPQEQILREQYRPGNRMKFFISEVEMTNRGPQIILSRSNKKMVESVFAQEIPEIATGEVVVKGIARDGGNRSKVAVYTDDDNIDPIGSCIGQRGSRITTIIEELGGEKIDVIQYSDDAEDFIKHALSPAKILRVELNEETKEAIAHVEEDQFSLAIGRGGQNVRLAAELTGWTIKVKQDGTDNEVSSEEETEEAIIEKKDTEKNGEENIQEELKEESPVEEEKVESAEETEEK